MTNFLLIVLIVAMAGRIYQASRHQDEVVQLLNSLATMMGEMFEGDE